MVLQPKSKQQLLLIIEDKEKEQRYLNRVLDVAGTHGIKVFTITPADVQNSCKGL